MRQTFAPILALLLAACASSGPVPISSATSGPRVQGRSAPSARLDVANALASAGAANAITTAQARTLFGAPDVERRDGAGAMMVWTTPVCAFTLGFANDRLKVVEPGPRRTGDRAPSVAECLAELRARTPS